MPNQHNNKVHAVQLHAIVMEQAMFKEAVSWGKVSEWMLAGPATRRKRSVATASLAEKDGVSNTKEIASSDLND
jgi:hypothetical protein